MIEIPGTISYLLNFLAIAAIFSIVSLGLNLQWGYTGLFNVSVAAFWGIGAYTAAIVAAPPGGESLGFGLPFLVVNIAGMPIPIPVAIIVAAIASGVIALLIGIPTLRLREDYLAIATLGLAETIRLIILNEGWLTNGGKGLAVNNPLLQRNLTSVWLLIVALIFLGIVYWVIETGIQGPWGRVLKAIRDDEDVAVTLGKDTFTAKMESLIIGSMMMGVGGAIMALWINYLVPSQFNSTWTFYIWIAVIIGGGGDNRGAVLGGLTLAVLFVLPRFLQSSIGSAVPGLAENLRLISIGVIIIIVLTLRPQGILGNERSGESQ